MARYNEKILVRPSVVMRRGEVESQIKELEYIVERISKLQILNYEDSRKAINKLLDTKYRLELKMREAQPWS